MYNLTYKYDIEYIYILEIYKGLLSSLSLMVFTTPLHPHTHMQTHITFLNLWFIE